MPDEQIALESPATEEAADQAMDQEFEKADAETESADTDETAETTEESDEAESVTEKAEPAEEPPAEEEPDAEATEKEADAEEEPEADTDKEDDAEGEITPDKTSDDGKTLHFRAAKAHRLLKANKDMEAIQEAIPDASLDTLKAHYESHVAFRRMAADVQSGEPDKVQNFMESMFGDSEVAKTALPQVAAQLPAFLQKANPDALSHLESQVHTVLIGNLYRLAQKSGADQDWALAQSLDKRITGNYQAKSDSAAPDGAPDDNLRQREERLAQEKREFDVRLRNESAQQKQHAQSALQQELDTTLDTQIEKALGPVAKAYRGKRAWNHMKQDLRQAVFDAGKANPTWSRDFEALLDSAVKRPSGESKKALTSKLEQFARPIIRRNLKVIVEESTGTEFKRSAEAHTTLKTGTKKREAPPSGKTSSRIQDLEKRIREGKATEDEILESVGF